MADTSSLLPLQRRQAIAQMLMLGMAQPQGGTPASAGKMLAAALLRRPPVSPAADPHGHTMLSNAAMPGLQSDATPHRNSDNSKNTNAATTNRGARKSERLGRRAFTQR